MRDRITKRRKKAADESIDAAIEMLEKLIVSDAQEELEVVTDKVEAEDAAIAEESTGVPVSVGEDQNELANENWPTEASADDDLEADAAALAKEEVAIVEEGTDIKVSEGGNQNDKAMKNWPVAERAAVASRLIKMAKALLKS